VVAVVSAGSTSAVLCEGLVRRFGAFTAVDGLSLETRAGEVFGLLGANGSGKSTTIRMLTGILPPTEGRVVVAGVDVVADPLGVREKIGYVAQKVSLYPNLRLAENVEFYGGIYGLSAAEVRERTRTIAPRLGLDRADGRALARDLPAGVRQRLAILLALLHAPGVIFLDEPTAGVDLANRRDLFDLMHELARDGISLFLTSHHLDEMERCDRLAFIDRGTLLGVGSADELKESLAGGRRYAVFGGEGESPAAVAGALGAAGFKFEPADDAHRGATFVLVRDEAEELRLAGMVGRGTGRRLHFAPPTLEAVFGRTVADRRRASADGLRRAAAGEGAL
jgi:ABC-2 type transport system ATP-binding protein